MKGKAIVPLILGLCVGLVAVKFLVDAVQKARGSTAAKETISVVRARVDIDSYAKITKELVELVETTDDAFAPSHQRFSTIDEIVGQVTAKTIPQYSPVLKTMLAPEGTPPGMRGMVKRGYRAVSVRIDEVTSVAYQLKPGDWVDVIVVMDVDTGSGRRGKETVAEVILQRVQVAAIGRATAGAPSQGGSKVKPAKSATLLVREEDAPKLHLAATKGKLTLTMRGDDDKQHGKPAIAYGSDVFSSQRLNKQVNSIEGPSKVTGSFLGAFLAQAATSTPDVVENETEAEHGVTLFSGSETGDVVVNQTIFASGRSRTIVGASRGSINKTNTSANNDRKRTQYGGRSRSTVSDRSADQQSESQTKSGFEEAE